MDSEQSKHAGNMLQAGQQRPAEGPFAVQHLHGRVSYRLRGWPAAADRFVMLLSEDTGNIWMMSNSGTH